MYIGLDGITKLTGFAGTIGHNLGLPGHRVIFGPQAVAIILHAVSTDGFAVGGAITSGQPG
jgi:hypothetical protein